jgi:hypothetical protein
MMPRQGPQRRAACCVSGLAAFRRCPCARFPAFDHDAHGKGLLVPQSLHDGGNIARRSLPRCRDPRAVIRADGRQFAADDLPRGLARGDRRLP